jgi:hypothetical protein
MHDLMWLLHCSAIIGGANLQAVLRAGVGCAANARRNLPGQLQRHGALLATPAAAATTAATAAITTAGAPTLGFMVSRASMTSGRGANLACTTEVGLLVAAAGRRRPDGHRPASRHRQWTRWLYRGVAKWTLTTFDALTMSAL